MSTRKYAIGEMLIFQNAIHEPELNGLECLVMAHRGDSVNPITLEREEGKYYGIEFQNGDRRSALEHQLRRREPPKPENGIVRSVDAPSVLA